MRGFDERGVVFPSPVVMLSVVAVAMAGIAYVATQDQEPTEREVTTVGRSADEPSSKPSKQAQPQKPERPEKIRPAVRRGQVYVEVYNNSGITGLAGRYAEKADKAGWNVVAADNWTGVIPASTVYYPDRLKRAARLLALDLGLRRTMPAIEGPMRLDRLTVVLNADAD